jgi:hypothetical protein
MRSLCHNTLAAIGILAGIAACSEKGPASIPVPQMSSASNQGRELRRSWENGAKALNRLSKSYPYDKLNLLLLLLKQASASQIANEQARIMALPTDYFAMSEYDQTCLQALVISMLNGGQTKDLVTLLSRKCPPYVLSSSIEYYLASSSHSDAILILFESYSQSKGHDARRYLLKALEQAFPDLRTRSEDDEAFVKASKQWYLQNKDTLKVNSNYPHVSGLPPPDPRIQLSADAADLFIQKDR